MVFFFTVAVPHPSNLACLGKVFILGYSNCRGMICCLFIVVQSSFLSVFWSDRFLITVWMGRDEAYTVL